MIITASIQPEKNRMKSVRVVRTKACRPIHSNNKSITRRTTTAARGKGRQMKERMNL